MCMVSINQTKQFITKDIDAMSHSFLINYGNQKHYDTVTRWTV